VKKLLVISRFCPSDAARYAGSKTHNYYLKRLALDFEVKLISFAAPNECPSFDLKEYGIDHDVSLVDGGPRNIPLFLLYNWWNAPNYFGKTLGLINGYLRHILVKKLLALRDRKYLPDIVLLEWTQILLMVREIKKVYPAALYVASEHDVTFLRLRRQLAAARGLAWIREKLRCESLAKAELASLRLVDVIAPHSAADANLLVKNGLPASNIRTIAPYVADFSTVNYRPAGRQILFYGAMDREDNYKGAIWFMERVFFPLLPLSFTLCILGGCPHRSLDKYRSERVVVTGFVADLRLYFSQSLCMAAPLLLGAGIKVKVIEAMSAGLPVLANRVAMEGIPAVHGVHYLHCEQPGDYKEALDAIAEGRIDGAALSKNARELVAAAFNRDASYAAYKDFILSRFAQTASQRTVRP
jgi:glycosyltransferase involved in cell wall biosynthesis